SAGEQPREQPFETASQGDESGDEQSYLEEPAVVEIRAQGGDGMGELGGELREGGGERAEMAADRGDAIGQVAGDDAVLVRPWFGRGRGARIGALSLEPALHRRIGEDVQELADTRRRVIRLLRGLRRRA